MRIFQEIKETLSNHPTIVNFRWSPTQSYVSTWSFLIFSISVYVISATFLHTSLSLLRRLRPGLRVPLGPIPALHSLATALASAVIFIGTLLSAAEEIQETRWLWRRTGTSTAIHWLLCFPLGTRPAGRVFFWSNAYYLSRFILHLPRTYFTILKRGRLTFFTLFNQSILLFTSFLWLEFSQSFQVVAILLTTSLYAVVYGYRFWTALGLPKARFPFVINCQVVVLGCNLVCHLGVLGFHLLTGGCNGIGAWEINFVLNGVLLLLVGKFYVEKMQLFLRGKKDD